MRGTPGSSTFSRAVGLQQGRREHSRVFLEAGGLRIVPTWLWLGAGEALVGLKRGN